MTHKMTALDLARVARELISEPERWTQHVFSRDQFGRDTAPNADDAVCWCSVGALRCCDRDEETQDEVGHAFQAAVGEDMDAYNDTHTEVLATWDRTIAYLEGQS